MNQLHKDFPDLWSAKLRPMADQLLPEPEKIAA
jgi:hypothetical protein